jgi:hypothetical protein
MSGNRATKENIEDFLYAYKNCKVEQAIQKVYNHGILPGTLRTRSEGENTMDFSSQRADLNPDVNLEYNTEEGYKKCVETYGEDYHGCVSILDILTSPERKDDVPERKDDVQAIWSEFNTNIITAECSRLGELATDHKDPLKDAFKDMSVTNDFQLKFQCDKGQPMLCACIIAIGTGNREKAKFVSEGGSEVIIRRRPDTWIGHKEEKKCRKINKNEKRLLVNTEKEQKQCESSFTTCRWEKMKRNGDGECVPRPFAHGTVVYEFTPGSSNGRRRRRLLQGGGSGGDS